MLNLLDEDAEAMPIIKKREDSVEIKRVLSNSFSFGGTNACLVFEKYDQ